MQSFWGSNKKTVTATPIVAPVTSTLQKSSNETKSNEQKTQNIAYERNVRFMRPLRSCLKVCTHGCNGKEAYKPTPAASLDQLIQHVSDYNQSRRLTNPLTQIIWHSNKRITPLQQHGATIRFSSLLSVEKTKLTADWEKNQPSYVQLFDGLEWKQAMKLAMSIPDHYHVTNVGIVEHIDIVYADTSSITTPIGIAIASNSKIKPGEDKMQEWHNQGWTIRKVHNNNGTNSMLKIPLLLSPSDVRCNNWISQRVFQHHTPRCWREVLSMFASANVSIQKFRSTLQNNMYDQIWFPLCNSNFQASNFASYVIAHAIGEIDRGKDGKASEERFTATRFREVNGILYWKLAEEKDQVTDNIDVLVSEYDEFVHVSNFETGTMLFDNGIGATLHKASSTTTTMKNQIEIPIIVEMKFYLFEEQETKNTDTTSTNTGATA